MILLIESGSTNTTWRILEDSKTNPIEFFSPGINPYYETIDHIKTTQIKILEEIIKFQIKKIYYYGTGITGEKEKQIINSLFTEFLPSCKSINIKNDLESAAISCLGNENGIACILGTGSNSGYFENGILYHQVPPLGFWLGDEGSGGNLGKSLILYYLHKEMPEEILKIFIKRFGELSRIDILQKAYKEEFPNRWFATFSKFIFDNRKHPFIYQMIQNSFREFTTNYLLKYPQIKTTKVHFTGSVAFYFSDILRSILAENQITCGLICENPMAGLTLFHKKELET